MRCPKCRQAELAEKLAVGTVVDVCPNCSGIWLDAGEIYRYVQNPKPLHEELTLAYRAPLPAPCRCPRCDMGLKQVRLQKSRVLIEVCPKCRGNWLDAEEAPKIWASLKAPPLSPAPSPLPAAPLAALPSLALRSAGVMASLYGILAAFLYLLCATGRLPVGTAVLSGLIVILLNFLLGPLFLDLSLRWLHSCHWVELAELPEHLREFLPRACQTMGIPPPRLALIEDGNPNAFTYGHLPSNARLVLTRGLIDLLDEEELEAVLGHELGHIRHYDMLVMTAAALVPIILYYIYRFCMRASKRQRSSSGKKGGNPLPLIGLAALILYYVTKFLMLFLSRLREYHADRASGELTREPSRLASALVKIAYGLVQNKAGSDEEKREENAVAATLGIFDPLGAKALAATAASGAEGVSTENILSAMQWDLWNPWAAYYELQSTHPLAAKRIQRLGEQAAAYGKKPLVHFNLEKPESYWDEFLVDLFVDWLPFLCAGLALGLRAGGFEFSPFLGPDLLLAFGAGLLFQTLRMYPTGLFPESSVRSLLKEVKVSAVRGVPAELTGTVIGKGTPGYIFSEDFVLQDETGIILIDYRQPLSIFELIFALTSIRSLAGQKVTVRGWYRRSPVPYFELRAFSSGERSGRSYTLAARHLAGALMILGALAWASGFFQ